jgi:GntR family carbon starvation induced transcriptional regulator
LTILERSQPQPPMSAGDSGYHRIRSDIIFGVLTPSGRLKLDSMKEDYGVSVSTLREILNRLASEGFVVAEGQRGFEVAPVSIQNLRELAQLRILLEHHAMTESFRAGDMEWEGRSRTSQALRQRIPSSLDIELRLARTHANPCRRVR